MADDLFRAEIDPANLRALLASVKAFDKNLATGLRRTLRQQGQSAIQDMRGVLGGGEVGGAIGAGIRVQIQTAKSRQGIRIQATTSKMPSGKEPLVKAFNKATFRHRVYGGNVWVNQSGRPYFGSVIYKHRDEIRSGVEAALADALKGIRT